MSASHLHFPQVDVLLSAQERASKLGSSYDRFPPKSGHLPYRKTPTTGEVDGALERRVANVVPSLLLAQRSLVELDKMDPRVTGRFRS